MNGYVITALVSFGIGVWFGATRLGVWYALYKLGQAETRERHRRIRS